MSFLDTFLKYENCGWVCSVCGCKSHAVCPNCVVCKTQRGKLIPRPFPIEEVKTVEYFDGLEERFKKMSF